MTSMKLTVLGTSGATPTKERNLTSAVLQFQGKAFLLDCSEGAQMQLMKAGVSPMKVDHVFITHWHGDHYFGLFGFLHTLNLLGRTKELTIHCPKSPVIEIVKLLAGSEGLSYDLKFKHLREGVALDLNEFKVKALKNEHSIPCYGFVFEHSKGKKFNKRKALKLGVPEGPLFSKLQRGESVKVNGKTVKPESVLEGEERVKKIAYFVDTIVTYNHVKQLNEADLLFHECTFLEKDADKAEKTMHSTALQAAKLAKKAKVKKLVGIHFSARYKDSKEILKELKKEFPKSETSKDLQEFKT